MTALPDVPIDTTTGHDEDDGDEPNVLVQVSICGAGGVHWAASGSIPGEATDDLVASTILRASLAAASLHSNGAWFALQRIVTDHGRDAA